MVTKNDFSPADWNTLRDAPSLVGFATLQAGASGLGTVKELFAFSQAIMENQASDVPLIRDLTGIGEMQASQASMKKSFGGEQGKPSPDRLRELALEQVRSSIAILEGKGSKEETDAYRRMVYGIAEKVANAASEGGFMGFGGGARVSEGEQSFLDDLRSALQLEQVKRA
jgi:hypothetical protein